MVFPPSLLMEVEVFPISTDFPMQKLKEDPLSHQKDGRLQWHAQLIPETKHFRRILLLVAVLRLLCKRVLVRVCTPTRSSLAIDLQESNNISY